MNNLEKAKAAIMAREVMSAVNVTPQQAYRQPQNYNWWYDLQHQLTPAEETDAVAQGWSIEDITRRGLKSEICRFIKTERKVQGLSQRELAKKSYCSQGTIGRAEKNLWVSLDRLLNIINALGKKITFS